MIPARRPTPRGPRPSRRGAPAWRATLAVALSVTVSAAAWAPAARAAPPTGSPAPRGARTAVTPARALARARVCRAALDYPCTERELAAARAGLSALPADSQRDVLALSAEVALAQGRREAADDHLDALLALDPTFEPPLDAWPPAWRARLDAARARAPDRLPPTLTVHLPVAARPGEPVTVEVVAEDASGVSGVSLWLARDAPSPVGATGGPRSADEQARSPRETKLATTDGKTWRGTIAGGAVRGPALRLWVTAWDQRGNGPARWGSPEAPKTLPVVAPPKPPGPDEGGAPGATPKAERGTPLVDRWWFWAAIGAGLAATATGTYLLVRPEGEPRGGTANVDVELTWPSL